MTLSIIAIAIILIYVFLIARLSFGFNKVADFKLQDLPSKTKFTIIIPFRNEAENLPKLIASIYKLNYSKSLYEIILVDDASEDNSIQTINSSLLKKYSDANQAHFIRVIKNKRSSASPKKDAITTAIAQATHDWILTTDADCILPKYWLESFDQFIQSHDTNCIAGPVIYNDTSSFFNRFQTLDFLSLQGVTIGSFGYKQPFLCNGANLGYHKNAFKKVKGFKGNTNIASGDDVFLLEKFIKHAPKKLHYLKSNHAIVRTNPTQNLKKLIEQRVRWASKTRAYSSWQAKGIGLVVLLVNLMCIAFIPLVLFSLLSLKTAVNLFLIKFSIDFLLLFKSTRFFKQETLLLSYLFSSVIYPFFSVYVAILALFKSYEWKGRSFKT